MINENISMYDAASICGNIWFSNNTYNSLFVMDSHTYNIKSMGMFPLEDEFGVALHKQVIEYKDKLFFLPANADNISVYNLVDNKFEVSIPINRCGKEYAAGGLVNGNELMVFPLFADQSVMQVNMDTMEYKSSDCLARRCIEFAGLKANDYLLTRASMHDNNKIIFGIVNTDIICIYDFSDDQAEFKHVGIDTIFGVINTNNKIWIIPSGGDSIYLWNDKDENVTEWKIEGYRNSDNYSSNQRPANKLIAFRDKTILLPSYDNEIYISNDEKKVFEKSGIIIPKQDCSFGKITTFGAINVDEDLLILPFSTSIGVKISSSFEATSIDFMNSDKEFVYQKKHKYIEKYFSPACENDTFKLPDFLKCCVL